MCSRKNTLAYQENPEAVFLAENKAIEKAKLSSLLFTIVLGLCGSMTQPSFQLLKLTIFLFNVKINVVTFYRIPTHYSMEYS